MLQHPEAVHWRALIANEGSLTISFFPTWTGKCTDLGQKGEGRVEKAAETGAGFVESLSKLATTKTKEL